jgi:FtsH-binding integral membrane protein
MKKFFNTLDNLFWKPNPGNYNNKLIKGLVWAYYLFIILLIAKTVEKSSFFESILTVFVVIIFLNLIPFQIYRLIKYIIKK